MENGSPANEATVRTWSEGSATGAFLTHFQPGRHELGEEHRSWLLQFAARLGSLTGNLYIVGLTDRAATEEDSRALGDQRAREVYRFLRSRARAFPWVDVHVGSTGDSVIGTGAERVARDRAVAVVHVAPGWVPIRWLREMVQAGPQPTSIFYVRAIQLGDPVARRSREESPAGATEGPAEPERVRPRMELQIGDGRWSVRYRAFEEGPEPSTERGSRTGGPVVLAEGPWHTFTAPFDLRVDEFGGSSVRLSGSVIAGEERLDLRIVRPPAAIAPFLAGAGWTPGALVDPPLGTPDRGGDPGTVVGRLDATERGVRRHSIPPEIRAHLRRGGAAGPRTRQGDLVPG